MRIKTYLKLYFKKLMLEVINESIPKTQFQDLIMEDKEVTSNVLNVMKFFEIQSLDLKIKYIDENNQDMSYDIVAETPAGFFEKIKKFNLPSDIISLKSLDFQVWYFYKGERRLEVERFLGWSGRYDKKALERAQESILKMFADNPELLL